MSKLAVPSGEELHAVVRDLASGIGPRPAASDAEGAAASVVSARLARLGFEVAVEPFRAVPTDSWTFILVFGLLIAAWFLDRSLPGAGALLGGVALLLLILETQALPVVGWLLPGKRESRNVVGIRQAAGLAARRVLLVAHLDSARPALFFHPRLVAHARLWFVLSLASALVLPTLSLFTKDFPALWWFGIPAALWLGASALVFVERELFRAETPGANDDASGIAVLLGVAAALPPLETTELWAVVTGSKESGLFGMLDFFRRHRRQLNRNRDYFVNFETVGRGELVCSLVEGQLQTFPVSSELVDAIKLASAAEGVPVRPVALTTSPTDASVPLARSFKAISLLAMDAKGRLPNWHWETDRPDQVDPANLEQAARLIARSILLFEAGQVPPETRPRR